MPVIDPLFQLKHLPMMISIFSGVAALWLGRKERGLLWYYVLASFGADIIGLALLMRWLPLPRFWQSNLFLLVELLLVSHYLIRHSMTGGMRQIASGLSFSIGIFFILNTVLQKETFLKSVTTLNYTGAGVLYTFLVFLLIWVFYKIITEIVVAKIEQSALFIFSSAMLLYVAPSMIIMLGWEDLKRESPVLYEALRDLRLVLNILKNLAIAYIFYSHGRFVTSKHD